MYGNIIHSIITHLRIVFVAHDIPDKNAKCLEASIDQLTNEHQSYFLGILEALTYAQNIVEKPTELEEIKDNK